MHGLTFGLDKNNVLYISTPRKIFAASLSDLDGDSKVKWWGEKDPNAGSVNRLHTFGPSTRKGMLDLDDDYRCMYLYDSKISFKQKFSVYALFDHDGRVDFNQLTVEDDRIDPNKLNIYLVQLTEAIDAQAD